MLKPDQNQILRYGGNDSIIIERLISESPKGKTEPYNLAIEKLIVDLFANKRLKEMISPGDYPAALESIFSMYKVDQVKMFRYARRRNKDMEIFEFLKNKTNVDLNAAGFNAVYEDVKYLEVHHPEALIRLLDREDEFCHFVE